MEEVVVNTQPSRAGLAPDVLPEAENPLKADSSPTGVSTRNNPFPNYPPLIKKARPPRWYVIKTTYGREQKGNDYLTEKGIETFYPTVTSMKEIQGKRKKVRESRIPNLFFAHSTEETLTPLVQQNAEAPYLRFYCSYSQRSDVPRRQLIIVPRTQMESLMKICEQDNLDTLVYCEAIHKFEKGALVRITAGPFAGVVGRVARFKGQQRVGVVVNQLLTAVTAYIPNGYLEPYTE